MKVVIQVVILVVMVAVAVYAADREKEVISVNVESDAQINWSELDYSNNYCIARGKRCPGEPYKTVFAATERQCLTRCNRGLDGCATFYFTKSDKQCQLMHQQCGEGDLIPAEGNQLFRLKKDAACTLAVPGYVMVMEKYTRKFCKATGKRCAGSDLYKRPLSIKYMIACLQKCAKIRACNYVDFNGFCRPKADDDGNCGDDFLEEDGTVDNYMRLAEGVDACPGNREIIDTPKC